MKKTYIKPELCKITLPSLMTILPSSGEKGSGDESIRVKEFEGPTGFLWEDDTNEQ